LFRPSLTSPHLAVAGRIHKEDIVGKFVPRLAFVTLLIPALSVGSAEANNPLESLVATAAQRLTTAQQVALAKWDSGAAVEDAHREAMVVDKAVKDGNARGLDAKQVGAFFTAQIEANKLVQYSLLADWRRKGEAPAHKQIDLAQQIRPQLDAIDQRLIAQLSQTAGVRSAKGCDVDLARAVGRYLHSRQVRTDSRTGAALDRALATACIR
jgi:chorismate mutase